MGKHLDRLLTLGAIAAGAGIVGKKLYDSKKKEETVQKVEKACQEVAGRNYEGQNVYLVGGGLATMAAAAFLIRDCNFPGEQITLYEGMHILGGSNDGIGTPEKGFVCRGGRMLNEETYENFWDLFRSIPSLEQPGRSVTEEILNFDHAHPTHAKARLVDKDGHILDVESMGFTQQERMALLKLVNMDEDKLDSLTIMDWFKDMPHFFTTNFWHMWQTTFAFQTWSSLYEFRRYMRRMIFEFSRIETLEGVTRTPYNQYDSVIRPLEEYLRGNNVNIIQNCTVTDIDFAEGADIKAEVLHLNDNGVEKEVKLGDKDICIMTNACMTDSATLGDLHTPAPEPEMKPISGELWAKVAAKKPGLGNPEPFFGNVHESNWESFTVTCRGSKMLKVIENFTGNIPGSGALMTFKDSGWKMSSVVAAQPHFPNQPMDVTIFWGYGLYTDHLGDYVKKPMKDCTGEEILTEYLHQLHLSEEQIEDLMKDVINVIPCFMPYVDAQFQPRKKSDRPAVVPEGSVNFAMVSQFVEIPEDMVFTEEYSVRAARIAVYTLMGVDRPICPVTPYVKDPKVLMRAVKKAYM
ncbi:oleate hydratase [Clostridium sp. AM58-1XD]|uniref:oleate hydratase n=1 Tax=Clostridium sp. AM58-1XD TaxID=2292307 RepID=UPI000E52FE41|nr:oleate hydratase [Clostridium sp. AM58-1XD]RGY97343.1 oleate hydratase [Clostridium sp. AM58-1XD]